MTGSQLWGLITTIASVMIAAFLIAGCGTSARAQIRDTVDHYTVDIGADNWKAACRLTTGKFKTGCEQVAKQGGAYGVLYNFCRQGGSSIGSCKAMASANAKTGEGSWVVSKVVISGKAATVAFTGRSNTLTLRQVGGSWLVSGKS